MMPIPWNYAANPVNLLGAERLAFKPDSLVLIGETRMLDVIEW